MVRSPEVAAWMPGRSSWRIVMARLRQVSRWCAVLLARSSSGVRKTSVLESSSCVVAQPNVSRGVRSRIRQRWGWIGRLPGQTTRQADSAARKLAGRLANHLTTKWAAGLYTLRPMASVSEFVAAGRVIGVEDNAVVFQPLNTTYEWKLVTAGRYDGPVNERIECRLTVKARKLYTVPSGGNFVQPIFGPPRIVQGRVKHLEERLMVVHAAAPFVVELPKDEDAY